MAVELNGVAGMSGPAAPPQGIKPWKPRVPDPVAWGGEVNPPPGIKPPRIRLQGPSPVEWGGARQR